MNAEADEFNVDGLNDADLDESLVHDKALEQQMELERLKARMAELQAQIPGHSSAVPGSSAIDGGSKANSVSDTQEDQAAKEEIDARSVYVGNVDYECSPEEVQQHFQSCGTVNRVTILTDKFGGPKGFAYVEFLEVDAVAAACLLSDTELKGRQIKVNPKRTNVPGLKSRGRGGRFPRGRGGRRGGYSPYGYNPYGGYRGRRGRGYGYY